MSALIKDGWSLVHTCAFDLLQYIVLVEMCEQNAASDRDVGGKRKCILVFSDNCKYSS